MRKLIISLALGVIMVSMLVGGLASHAAADTYYFKQLDRISFDGSVDWVVLNTTQNTALVRYSLAGSIEFKSFPVVVYDRQSSHTLQAVYRGTTSRKGGLLDMKLVIGGCFADADTCDFLYNLGIVNDLYYVYLNYGADIEFPIYTTFTYLDLVVHIPHEHMVKSPTNPINPVPTPNVP